MFAQFIPKIVLDLSIFPYVLILLLTLQELTKSLTFYSNEYDINDIIWKIIYFFNKTGVCEF
jgi:hypothetical protein